MQARGTDTPTTHAQSHITQEEAAVDSCLAFIGIHQHERGKPVSQRPSTAEANTKHSFMSQLHTTHVGTVGWEPQCSFPTTCAGKADHGLVYVCDVRRTLVKLVNRSPSARDPTWVITPVNSWKVWSIA